MTANAAEMLRALYSAAPVAVIMLDKSGRIESANPAATRLFGQTEASLAGQRGDVLFATPREFDALVESGFGLGAEREMHEFTARYRARGGRILDGETVASLVTGPADGPALGTLLIIRDVSAERSLQARLEASDIQLRAALASANEGAFSLNLATGLGSSRGFINEFLGIQTSDATIRLERLLDVIAADMRDTVAGAISRLSRAPGEALHVTFRAERADGETRWLEMRGRVSEFARDGSPLRLSGVIADVTERQSLEEQLAERERQLANAIDAGSCGVWELDTQTRHVTLIGPIRDMLGLEPGQSQIDTARWLARIHTDQRDSVIAQIDALAAGESDRMDVEYQLHDARTDSWTWLRSRGRRLSEEAGGRLAAGILTDINERKALQSRLAANERMLREAVESASEGAWSLDVEAGTLRASGLLASLLGMTGSDEAVPARRWADAILEDDLEAGRKRFQRLLQLRRHSPSGPRGSQAWEFRMRGRDGEVLWLRAGGQIVDWTAGGGPARIAGTVINITEERRLRDELDQSEARLREALAGAREGAWHFDLQTRVGEVTGIISEMMGLPPRDARVSYDDWAARIHPDDMTDARHFVDAMAGGKTASIDTVVRYRSEADGWIHIHIRGRVSAYDAGGTPRVADGFITDISERVRTERRLSQREQQLAEAVDAASVGLWRIETESQTVTLQGTVVAELIADETETTIALEDWFSRLHPDDLPAVDMARQAFRDPSHGPVDAAHRVRDRNGDWIWYRSTGSVVERDADGMPRAISGVIWNIDAAHRAEAELAERQMRFERIFRATPAMMHTIDSEGYIVEVSDYWLAHLGYRREEVIGRKSIDFLDAESRKRAVESNLPELFRTGSNTNIPYRFLRSDGSAIDVLLSSFLERGGEGQPLRSYATLTDVTALREANLLLERSNRELDQFATVASHDLQEPLRKIAAFSSLVRRRYGERLDEDGRRNLEFLVDAAHRMQRLIDDLLTYSRLASQPFEYQPVDLAGPVAQALENLDASVSENHARIEIGDMPTVRADPAILTQIFQNLIGNALKYRSFATPEVDISARRDGDRWIVAVSDNGIGLDIKFAEKIFAPFQRLHSHEAYPGTGIGLAMVRQAVERHGGEIWVKSAPGSGATFYFTLPADRSVPAPEPVDLDNAAK